MAIHFRSDVVSAGRQPEPFARKANARLNASLEGRPGPGVTVRFTRTEVYESHATLSLSTDPMGTLLVAYLETKKVIREQVAIFMDSRASAAREPADAEAPVSGGFPEYWNREYTARRILAIALMGYREGADRGDMADRASAMVKQAYRDVGAMTDAGLPDLVLDTMRTVLAALEQFRSGIALTDISFD